MTARYLYCAYSNDKFCRFITKFMYWTAVACGFAFVVSPVVFVFVNQAYFANFPLYMYLGVPFCGLFVLFLTLPKFNSVLLPKIHLDQKYAAMVCSVAVCMCTVRGVVESGLSALRPEREFVKALRVKFD